MPCLGGSVWRGCVQRPGSRALRGGDRWAGRPGERCCRAPPQLPAWPGRRWGWAGGQAGTVTTLWEAAMSTGEDPASGAGGMAQLQVPGLEGGELREGYAELGDQRLHYVEAGQGPLVVLLHG